MFDKLCKVLCTFFLCTIVHGLSAQESDTSKEKNNRSKEISAAKEFLKEETSETSHSVTINGVELHYKAVAGNLLLRNDQQHPQSKYFLYRLF